MKNLIKAISIYGWKYKRKEEQYNYIVVDMNKFATYNGEFSHYEAYKTEMFTTLEEANQWVENHIAKSCLHNIKIYQEITFPPNDMKELQK